MKNNNLPTGDIRSQYVLPIYEHIKINGYDYLKIKCFVGYKVVAYKYKKHIEKALLKVKVLTGSDAGSTYKGKYVFATDDVYNEEFMLKFGEYQSQDKLYIFEHGGDYFLHDYNYDSLRIHHFNEDEKEYASTQISLSRYTTIDELEKIQEEYNAGIQKLINTEKQKEQKTDNIF